MGSRTQVNAQAQSGTASFNKTVAPKPVDRALGSTSALGVDGGSIELNDHNARNRLTDPASIEKRVKVRIRADKSNAQGQGQINQSDWNDLWALSAQFRDVEANL